MFQSHMLCHAMVNYSTVDNALCHRHGMHYRYVSQHSSPQQPCRCSINEGQKPHQHQQAEHDQTQPRHQPYLDATQALAGDEAARKTGATLPHLQVRRHHVSAGLSGSNPHITNHCVMPRHLRTSFSDMTRTHALPSFKPLK